MSSRRAWAAAATTLLAGGSLHAQEPYVDRVLDDGPQPVLKAETELGAGWARRWRAEYGIARDSGAFSSTAHILGLTGSIDTPQHGTLSLNASIGRTWQDGLLRDRMRTWRFDQLQLPLDGGWFANHSAGDIPATQVRLTRSFGRVGLPSSQLAGLSGEWAHGSRSHQFTLAAGQPTLYTGVGAGGLTPIGGRLLFGGAQVQPQALPGSTFATQVALADEVRDGFTPEPVSARGLWAAWHWQGLAPWSAQLLPGPTAYARPVGGLELQANVIRTRAEVQGRPQRDAAGAWVDARWQTPLLAHSAGALYLEPGLRWGTYQMAADLRGAYWRGEYQARQWYWSGSAEWTDSISGRFGASTYAATSVRYRPDTRNTLVGAVAARAGYGRGTSGTVGWERATEWGQWYSHVEVLRSQVRRAVRAGLDHSIDLTADSALATTLAVERGEEFGASRRAFLWGIVGTLRPWTGVSLDLNLRGSHGDDLRVLHGGVGAQWQVTPNWSLLGQATFTRGQELRALGVLSPIVEASEIAVPPGYVQRRLQLTVRYQETAGRNVAPVGGPPGAAAGTLVGQVFLDENGNGRREASEAGAPDVVVRLDGRYTARTDATGRYSFPLVAIGVHRLELVKDNIPLPWNPATDAPQRVEVRVRAETTLDFPLRREP